MASSFSLHHLTISFKINIAIDSCSIKSIDLAWSFVCVFFGDGDSPFDRPFATAPGISREVPTGPARRRRRSGGPSSLFLRCKGMGLGPVPAIFAMTLLENDDLEFLILWVFDVRNPKTSILPPTSPGGPCVPGRGSCEGGEAAKGATSAFGFLGKQ